VAILDQVGVPRGFIDSIVLVESGQAFYRSTAILKILKGLGFPFSMAGIYGIVPRAIRDRVYDFVASHRFGWFGRRDTCRLPNAEERSRFV